MTVNFDQIPSNLLTPGVFTEVNGRRAAASNPELPRRVVLVGSRLSGSVATGVPFRIFAAEDAEDAAGVGSMLAEMAHVAKQQNRYVEMWGIGLDDNGSGVAATGTVTVTGPATAAGTLSLYVAPYWVGSTMRGRYQVAVSNADTATVIGDAIVAAITADPYRQVSAVNAAGVVTLTSRFDGTPANDISISHSYFANESLPAGVGVAIVAMASGATNADIATAISALGDAHTTHLVQPFTDASSLSAVETEMTRRWGGTVQRECHAWQAANGALGTLTTLGDGRNSELSTILGAGLSPSPSWIAAADLAALDAAEFHPGRPLRGRRLPSLLAPPAGDEFDGDERLAARLVPSPQLHGTFVDELLAE